MGGGFPVVFWARGKGVGRWGREVGGQGQTKEPASQCARVCQNYPLAIYLLVSPRSPAPSFLGGGGDLVSHYSAIGDTISCDAPCSAIGFRGKFFLRCPLVRSVSGLP